MLDFIVNDLVINLIGKNDQFIFNRDLDNSLKDFARVNSSRWVVGVDDDNALSVGRNLFPDILEVRVPVGFLVTDIVNSLAPCQGSAGSPERVIRRRDQNFIAVVHQCLHTERDQLTGAVSDIHILLIQVHKSLCLIILHNGFSCRENPLGVAISLRASEVIANITDNLVRSVQVEGRRISGIEHDDVNPFRRHPVCFLDDRAADIITDIVQLFGFFKSSH